MKSVLSATTRHRRLLLALVPLALAGCSMFGKAASTADEKTAAKPAPSLIRQPGAKTVVVGVVDAGGANIELARDQELTVRLPDTVAGGYEWSLAGFMPGVLDVQGPKFERGRRDGASSEFEGNAVWQFKPATSGMATLRFELRRPNNTAAAIQVVNYTVTVP